MATATSPARVGLYQGEDFELHLQFFTDVAQTQPLVFTDPVMEIRTARALLARFDSTGQADGFAAIPADGILVLTMPWARTVQVPAGTYPLDIFAEVNGRRRAITKVGNIVLVVTARITRDDTP